VAVAIDLGHRIADQYHPVIILDAASDGVRYADASRHPGNDASGDSQIAQNSVERCIREAAEALFGDQVLAIMWFQFVDDFRAPRPHDTVRSVAVRRVEIEAQGHAASE